MISLIIPCIPEHLNSLESILNDYATGSEKPDETIISLSNTQKLRDNLFIDYIKQKFNQLLPRFKIIQTSELLNRADNRNKAIKYATGDLITFSDADDRVHKQRIEIIKYFFNNHNIDFLLHSFVLKQCLLNKNKGHCLYCRDREDIYYQNYECENIKYVNNIDLYGINYPTQLIKPGVKNIIGWIDGRQVHPHHGFSTVKKKVLDNIKYNSKYPRGQDSLFCQEIVYNKYKTYLIQTPLMIYNNNWVPNIKDYDEFTDRNGDKILIDMGSKNPPYPAIPRSQIEKNQIREAIIKH